MSRFDKINVVSPICLTHIEELTKSIAEIDKRLIYFLKESEFVDKKAGRYFAEARTLLETASMFANKGLALMGDDKNTKGYN